MEEEIVVIAGLVGTSLMLAVGGWLGGFRDWLRGFMVSTNPLRILGDALSCTMSVGFFVGFAWGIHRADPWSRVIVWGGLISLLTYATDEVLALVDSGVRRLARSGPPPMPPFSLPKKSAGVVPESGTGEAVGSHSLTEDEAHAIAGERGVVRD